MLQLDEQTCTMRVTIAPITMEMRQNRNRFEMSRYILDVLLRYNLLTFLGRFHYYY